MIFAICAPVQAELAGFRTNDKLRSLNSLDDTKKWRGVGRINIGQTGFCTGTLIAPDLVLTAAHCFYDKVTGIRVPDDQIEFLAGLRGGRASAYRGAKRAVIHPGYQHGVGESFDRFAADLALIQLDRPIRNPSIKPFATTLKGRFGQEVQVVSYAKDRAEAPSLEETCHVIAVETSLFVTSCDVDFGASGAPVFVTENGESRIMSIVSAKAEWKDVKVSIAAGLEDRLATLLGQLDDADGVFQRNTPKARKLSLGEKRAQTGALFIKP